MEEKQKKRKVPLWAIILLAVLVILLVAGLLFASYLSNIQKDPSQAFEDAQLSAPTPTPVQATPTPVQATPAQATPAPIEATPTPTPDPHEQNLANADPGFMKNQVHILLVGWDESPERNDSSSELYRDENNNFRSDVLMVLTLDFDDNSASLLSVPRDTYAPIYNTEGRWKINAAFAKGGSVAGDGFHYAQETVGQLLGIKLPYYIGVNMAGLKNLVDALGGVDYDVDVEIRLNGRVLETGPQHLNGQQVLDYCRARKGIGTDLNRADRQQRMLMTIFSQIQENGKLATLPKIYLSMKDDVYTNLNFSQISSLAVFGMDLDTGEDLSRHTLEGEYMSAYNASFYVLDQQKMMELVKELYGAQPEPNPRYDLFYVKGDVAAKNAKSTLDCADYLIALCREKQLQSDTLTFPYDPIQHMELQAQRNAQLEHTSLLWDQLFQSSNRFAPVNATVEETDAVLDQALDEAAILSARQELVQSLLQLCDVFSLTREDVDPKLAAEVYDSLPTKADLQQEMTAPVSDAVTLLPAS